MIKLLFPLSLCACFCIVVRWALGCSGLPVLSELDSDLYYGHGTEMHREGMCPKYLVIALF